MLRLSPIGLELIKRFEGFSPVVYLDAAGLPTIGYGHLLKAGEAFPQGMNEQEASVLLVQDVKLAENAVRRLISAPLTQGQWDALVSFTFNLGAGALQRSTLRHKLNRGEYRAAADEFPRWVWAGGHKLRGLVVRREAERERFLEV